jgi:hypothetical protein
MVEIIAHGEQGGAYRSKRNRILSEIDYLDNYGTNRFSLSACVTSRELGLKQVARAQP